MTRCHPVHLRTAAVLWLLAAAAVCLTGCVSHAQHAIPASRLPPALSGPMRDNDVPINLSLLRQDPVAEYRIDTGDVLGVYVQGVVPPQMDAPPPFVPVQGTITQQYYPPLGQVQTPSVGVPFPIGTNGLIPLPLVEPINVSGMTLDEAAESIRKAYLQKDVIQAGRDRIGVTLLRGRVHRVLVIREDSGSEIAQMARKDSVVFAKRGQAAVVDLPAYENDVLHALTATGGLPGLDCLNQVWILRSQKVGAGEMASAQAQVDAGGDPRQVLESLRSQATAIRIPLRTCINEPLPFGSEDILLYDGDIVYLEPRIADVFYTGGLLPGGQIPLPRDHDVDLLEAIALAQGSVGGPGGVSGTAVFRAGAGPGFVVPPTRVLVVRKLPNGEQLAIRADLTRALRDSKERIVIQPGDLIMLYFKPGEMAANIGLNFFNFNFILNPFEI